MLGSYFDMPGGLPTAAVADVFAGSGSMGLEALSRGAGSCCFFERDREALRALRENVRALNAEAAATVITRDAWSCAPSAPDGSSFDLVFLDPPYADSDDDSAGGPVRRYLDRLCARAGTMPLVVLHHRARAGFTSVQPDPWKIVKQRVFGSHTVSWFAI